MTARNTVQSFHIPLAELGDRALALEVVNRAKYNNLIWGSLESRDPGAHFEVINYTGLGLTELVDEVERRIQKNPASILVDFLKEVNAVLKKTGSKKTLDQAKSMQEKIDLLNVAGDKIYRIEFQKASPAETDDVILLADFARLAKALSGPFKAHSGDRVRMATAALHQSRGIMEKELNLTLEALVQRNEPRIQETHAALVDVAKGKPVTVNFVVSNWSTLAKRPAIAQILGMMEEPDGYSI